MTFHSLIEYVKYRWRAKGLHGTHSPFVYDFIDRILLDYDIIPRRYIVVYPSLPLRFENIVSRIAAYYKYDAVWYLPEEQPGTLQGEADMLLLSGTVPGQWQQLFEAHKTAVKNGSAIVATDIHKTTEHTAAWNQLCKAPETRMSLDLYGIGILLFRKEFTERQQFVLAY